MQSRTGFQMSACFECQPLADVPDSMDAVAMRTLILTPKTCRPVYYIGTVPGLAAPLCSAEPWVASHLLIRWLPKRYNWLRDGTTSNMDSKIILYFRPFGLP